MEGTNYKNFLATGNEVYIEFISDEYLPNDTNWYGFKLMYFNNQGEWIIMIVHLSVVICTSLPIMAVQLVNQIDAFYMHSDNLKPEVICIVHF